MVTAISAADFVGRLGVNTHIDFANYGYQNLSVVEASVNYLGLKNLRDSPQAASDASSWLQVSQATGAKFDAYIPEGSPSDMQNALNLMPKLAQERILNFIEGGNEEDAPYAAALGNTLQITANFQRNAVWPMGQQLGLPVINMSFGAGWTADNGWIGNYASVGDLAAYATYGNAHTYPVPGQTPDSTIQRINGLAKLADSKDSVVTTEVGWDRNQGYSQQTVAKYVLDATMDGIKDGDAKMYFYALFDDGAGKFGLMNQNGTPMPAGTAIHNLTTLLSDTGGGFTTGSLSYSLANTTANDNSLLLEKSDGTYWISLWDEVDRAHNVTVKLPSPAAAIKVFDPLTGTIAIQNIQGASSVTVRLTDHPLLVQVAPGTATPPPPPPPTLQPNDLLINVPTAGDTAAAYTTSALPGVSVTDPWAAQNPGLMALNLWDNSGAPLYVNGQQVTGTLSLTLSQLNADLAGLSYKAGAPGSDTVFVNVWNQAGVQDTESFAVTTKAAPSLTLNALTAAPTGASLTALQSNAILASKSDGHMHFIGGTDAQAILAGGAETAHAGAGYNTTTLGVGDSAGIHGADSIIHALDQSSSTERSGFADFLRTPANGLNDLVGSGRIDFQSALKRVSWDGQPSWGGSPHIHAGGSDTLMINHPVISASIGSEF